MASAERYQSLDDFGPEIARAAAEASTILTPMTDERTTETSYGRSLPVALALARLTGARLIVVDRSAETG